MITLKPATMDDAARLYGWRTDPTTNANSLTSEPLSFSSHCAWLEQTLASEGTNLFVARDPQRSLTVGSCRLDYRKEGSATELSITVDSQHRSRGYAAEILENVLATFPKQTFVARVKETNIPSLRVFWALGFRRILSADQGVLLLERTCTPS